MTERNWTDSDRTQIKEMHAAFQVLKSGYTDLNQATKAAEAALHYSRSFANRFLRLNTGEAIVFAMLFNHAVTTLAAERQEDPVGIFIAQENQKQATEAANGVREEIRKAISPGLNVALDQYFETVDGIARQAAGIFFEGLLPPSQPLIETMAHQLEQARHALPPEIFAQFRQTGRFVDRESKKGKGNNGNNPRRGRH